MPLRIYKIWVCPRKVVGVERWLYKVWVCPLQVVGGEVVILDIGVSMTGGWSEVYIYIRYRCVHDRLLVVRGGYIRYRCVHDRLLVVRGEYIRYRCVHDRWLVRGIYIY